MTRAARSLLVAVLIGACGGAPATVPSAAEDPALGSVLVTIEFEPALPAPARLQFVHESGVVGDLLTQCTGVVMALPPGPALLRLHCEGAWQELPVQVVSGMPVVFWQRAMGRR